MYKPYEIASIIKKLTQSKGTTIKQVLEDCEINKGFIYDLEHKQVYPKVDKIARLAEYFHVSMDLLLGMEPSDDEERI